MNADIEGSSQEKNSSLMIHFLPFQELASERIILRRLKQTDKKMIQFLRSDPEVNQFVRRPNAKTEKKALEFIRMIDEGIENEKHYYWVISLKTGKYMIGSISLWNFSNDRMYAEVGYDLHPVFQQQGLMTEALKRVLKFAFESLHLKGIEAYTQHNNLPSRKMLTSCGFELVREKTDPGNSDNLVYRIKNNSV